MKIIIAGGGKVGATLVRQLSAEGHDLTVIDANQRVLEKTVELFDVMAVQGNCASMPVLQQAGVESAELLIAVTNADEVNLLCCMTAHGLNRNLHTIARIRNPEYTDQIYEMRDFFALSMTVNPEKQAAQEIARLLKYPGFLRRDTFAKGNAEIVELKIDEKSALCGISLMDMYRTVKTRVLVCAVLRSGNAIAPKGDFVLKSGDRIFITAPSASLTALLKNLGIIARRVRRVILAGGDRICYYLAEFLDKDGVSVRIIEKNPDRCRSLAEQLPDVTVVHGDCSSKTLLEEEGLGEADALVTLTGMDEMNIIISMYGTTRGVRQVVTKLGRAENIQLSDSLDVGSVVCARELCSNNIVRYVRALQHKTGAALSVHSVADGQAEAVEFAVDQDYSFCGKPLKECKLKPNVLLASITHGKRSEVPGGDSVIHKGDTVVVVTSGRGTLHKLTDIFD